jgi:transcriptional regulator with XRE-family HTH domain
MEASEFQGKISRWRLEAEMSQEDLDKACGFKPGTVGRLEQDKLPLDDERLVRILICTDRDLLSTLAESYGALFKRLQPLEGTLRARFGKPSPPPPPDEDEEFRRGLAAMLSGLEMVLRKVGRVSDRRAMILDLLTEAAARDARSEKPARKRIRKPRR